MPVLVRAVGSSAQFAGLPSVPGVLLEDHGIRQLDDDLWSVVTYLTSPDVVAGLTGLGLQVEVLLTEAEVQARGEQIARDAEEGGTS